MAANFIGTVIGLGIGSVIYAWLSGSKASSAVFAYLTAVAAVFYILRAIDKTRGDS